MNEEEIKCCCKYTQHSELQYFIHVIKHCDSISYVYSLNYSQLRVSTHSVDCRKHLWLLMKLSSLLHSQKKWTVNASDVSDRPLFKARNPHCNLYLLNSLNKFINYEHPPTWVWFKALNKTRILESWNTELWDIILAPKTSKIIDLVIKKNLNITTRVQWSNTVVATWRAETFSIRSSPES